MQQYGVSFGARCEALKFYENPRIAALSKETVLSQSYKIPLNAFWLFTVRRLLRVPCN